MWSCCDCGSVFDVPDVINTKDGPVYICPFCGALAFEV